MNDDKQWFIVDGQNEEGSRSFINASLILTNDDWELKLWGENLTDEDSWASYEPVSLHGLPQDIGNLAPGRRYGLTATYRF
jgi:outer membrane receptor protein involved in Fe transport